MGLAFGCSSVYAQTINQTGNNNQVLANQTALNPASQYTINQTNDWNWVDLTQGGALANPANNITLTQISIGATATNLKNLFNVVQNGSGNTIIGNQLGRNNRATLRQQGPSSGGTITTSQIGERNGIVVTQSSGAGNTATVNQGTDLTPGLLSTTMRNSATLTQSGKAGAATITQSGSAGLVTAVQSGGATTANTMTIIQSNNAGAVVDQSGDNNKINADQKGYQYAKVTQGATSLNGTVTIKQGATVDADTRNSATVAQTQGDGNTATVTQTNANAEKNIALVTQSGTKSGATKSTVTVTQAGKSGYVDADQSGEGNKATFTQNQSALANGSVAILDQSGVKNEYKSTQTGNGHRVVGAVDTYSAAIQTGTDNEATITQKGSKQQAAFQQAASGNTLTVDQDGLENKATVSQLVGSGMTALIEQKEAAGNSQKNSATITQTGTDIADATTVTDPGGIDYSDPYNPVVTPPTTSTGGGSSAGLYAEILQEGREGIASIDQKGSSNFASIDQLADYSFQSKATIVQDGKGHVGKKDPTDPTSPERGARISQFGGRQNAEVVQAAGTEKSTITVLQGIYSLFNADVLNNPELYTNDNKAVVKQLAGSDNYIYLDQNNERNEATLTQESGNSNTIEVVQYPQDLTDAVPGGGFGNNNQDGNKVTITQKSGDENTAKLSQTGYSNELTLTQDGGLNILKGLYGDDVAQQTGNDNTATLTQTGDEQTISLEQSGDMNSATVDQTGMQLDALVEQAGEKGVADVDQMGEMNQALVFQVSGEFNDAMINQSGEVNFVAVGQDGGRNGASVLQSGTENVTYLGQSQDGLFGVAGNTAAIGQSGTSGQIAAAQVGSDNAAAMTQAGTDNFALGIQYGTSNTATTSQDAGTDGGTAVVLQGEFDIEDPGVQAAVLGGIGSRDAGSIAGAILDNTDIFGDEVLPVSGNTATVTQSAGNDQIGAIGQLGDDNLADLTQSGTQNAGLVLQGGEAKNMADIDQTGSQGIVILGQLGEIGGTMGNTANITQGGTENAMLIGQGGQDNTATIDQKGTGNGLVGGSTLEGGIAVGQYGSGNDVKVDQNATTSAVIIGQGNIDPSFPLTLSLSSLGTAIVPVEGNSADVTQTGEDNIAVIAQAGDDNTATVTSQAGMENDILILQTGDDNEGKAAQSGSENEGGIFQIGDGNFGDLTQNGTLSQVSIDQLGDNNEAEVDQKSGSKFNVTSVSQAGNENTAAVVQTGVNDESLAFGGLVLIDQNGNSGVAEATQGGVLNTIFITQSNSLTNGPSVGNKAYATQSEDVKLGVATIDQIGLTNTATIDQIKGSVLSASIVQSETGDATSDEGNSQDNTATITQDGTNGEGSISTPPGDWDYSDPYNPIFTPGTPVSTPGSTASLTAEITQQGREGLATINQTGSSNTATALQKAPYSFENEVLITQGGKGNEVAVQQFGGQQKATLEQGSAVQDGIIEVSQGIGSSFIPEAEANPELFTNGNVAFVYQLAGIDNGIKLVQDNQGSTATLTQDETIGDNNTIEVSQRPQDLTLPYPGLAVGFGNILSNGNTVTITQKTGDSNVAKLQQDGLDNVLTLTQDGSNNILRKSSGAGNEAALQNGIGGSATLSQTGTGHIINLNQGGVGNMTTITQMN